MHIPARQWIVETTVIVGLILKMGALTLTPATLVTLAAPIRPQASPLDIVVNETTPTGTTISATQGFDTNTGSHFNFTDWIPELFYKAPSISQSLNAIHPTRGFPLLQSDPVIAVDTSSLGLFLDNQTPTDSVHLYGHVTDLAGLPVSAAYLDLQDENYVAISNTLTNGIGFYEFTVSRFTLYHLAVSVWSRSASGEYLSPRYIPKTVDIRSGGASQVATDIVVRPGGNLILNVYDGNGNVVRKGAMESMTHKHSYVTNLTDLPYYGISWGVHDSYSCNPNCNWDLALPSFVVPLQTSQRLHVLWEVPGFGQIILDLDNEGTGYVVANQGENIFLNFNYEAAKSELAALQLDYNTFITQGYVISSSVPSAIQIADEYLRTAAGYLGQTPPVMPQAVTALNLTLKTALWAHEELYLEKANSDIERNRKGSLRLHIINAKGQSVSGARITFEQTNRDFLLSATPMGAHSQYDPSYATLLTQAGMNYSDILAPWKFLEPNPGQFDWSFIDSHQSISAQLADGFRLFGGLVLWLNRGSGIGGDQYCPIYLDNMTFPEQKANAYEHLRALGDRYRSQIGLWQTIHEQNLPWTNALKSDLGPEDRSVSLSHRWFESWKSGRGGSLDFGSATL